MDMHVMDWIWSAVTLLMVWRGVMLIQKGTRLFWAVHLLQALEIPALLTNWTWPLWSTLDVWVNLPLEMIAFASAGRYRAAQVVIGLHLVVKIAMYRDVDCDWQFTKSCVGMDARQWLNYLLIVTLLAYTYEAPILRCKERYRARRNRPAHHPA